MRFPGPSRNPGSYRGGSGGGRRYESGNLPEAALTAPFLPPIARSQKPVPREIAFRDISGDALAGIPGRRGLPVFGILPFAVRDPQRFARRMYERYGPVHRFYACGNWNVQLVGPEANELVLFDQAGNFSSRGGWKPVFGRHFDGGLLLRDGEDHQWHRKLIAFAFKQDQLNHYLAVFAGNIARLAEGWFGQTTDIYEFAQQLTFANGYAAFLGRDAAAATRQDMLAFRYLMRSATSVVTTPLPGNAEWRARWAKQHVTNLIRPMLCAPVAPERNDLLAVLVRMRDAGLIGDEEIIAHLTFVIAASFDALSSGTVSTLYYLANDPVWQDRVREELCESIANPACMTVEDVGRCEQAEWAVKEALRLNAAAPVLWRRAVRDVSFAGHHFPAGTVVGVNPMLTHLLPSIWDRPERYDPSRFTPENVRGRHRFAFVPFGGGAHGCLGANFAYLQIRALLRQLLERHELVLADSTPPTWYHWPNCRPLGGLRVSLRPRQKSPA
jgi:cytochrome P450